MSKRFKLVLGVRFVGYFIFLTGLISFVFVFGPLVQAEYKYRSDQIFGVKHTIRDVITSDGIEAPDDSGSFGNIKVSENQIVPVSTEYGIVIEKINANAKIIPDINPANESQYSQALTQGVAEAAGSTKPGQNGNTYLFSHSTDAPWNIVRFNAVFYLLRELNSGDRVIVFYQNKRYDYVVFDKVVVPPSDISYLLNRYDQPVLTLQTCDPPGTLLNRLIVRAKLVTS